MMTESTQGENLGQFLYNIEQKFRIPTKWQENNQKKSCYNLFDGFSFV